MVQSTAHQSSKMFAQSQKHTRRLLGLNLQSISFIGDMSAQRPEDTKWENLLQPQSLHSAAFWKRTQNCPLPNHQNILQFLSWGCVTPELILSLAYFWYHHQDKKMFSFTTCETLKETHQQYLSVPKPDQSRSCQQFHCITSYCSDLLIKKYLLSK